MKAIQTLKLAGGALLIVASFNAWSQSSDTAATSGQSGATSASQGSSKSTARKANRALSRKVQSALSKGGVNTAGINVLAKGGAITLAGRVTDASDTEKAVSIAKGVTGVTSVKNSLRVAEGGQ